MDREVIKYLKEIVDTLKKINKSFEELNRRLTFFRDFDIDAFVDVEENK